MIPPNVIIPFDGNHADVPSGFVRDTRFDSKFAKHKATGTGGTGGSDTHTHTVTHTHTIAQHFHRISFTDPINGSTHDVGGSGSVTGANHSHNTKPGTPYQGTEASGSTAAELASAASNSLPPYYSVIFIKSTSYKAIPINGMVYHTGTRTGLTYHSASENKYLRGAATGGNAGAGAGGTSHSHTQSHTHTANNHTHPNAYVGTYEGDNGGTNNDSEDGQNSPGRAHGGHNHTVDLAAASQAFNSDTTSSSTATGVEVAYYPLRHYKATTVTLPAAGDIALTTESTIPVGWVLCDGNNGTPNLADYYIKNTSSGSTPGGSNTHTHTLAHTHTGNGTHTHSASNPSGYSGESGGGNGSGESSRRSHQHNINSVSSVTGDYNQNTSTTSSAGSNEPAYIEVKYIQYKYSAMGGAVLFMS